ncbi:uncharacterized protein MYU51_003965 [Penicillium brevicompactum]
MQFAKSLLALVALGTSLGLAAPAPAPDKDVTQAAQSCPSEYAVCGSKLMQTCNGTSCKIAGTNNDCVHGSCVGDGGGDGAICGKETISDYASCPV